MAFFNQGMTQLWLKVCGLNLGLWRHRGVYKVSLPKHCAVYPCWNGTANSNQHFICYICMSIDLPVSVVGIKFNFTAFLNALDFINGKYSLSLANNFHR